GIAVPQPTDPTAPREQSDRAVLDLAERFDAAWDARCPPSLPEYLTLAPAPLHPRLAIALACIDMERRFRHGLPIDVAAYLQDVPALAADGEAAREQLEAHLVNLCKTTATPPPVSTPEPKPPVPERIGRYVVHRRIDGGGQATAYLGV